MPKSVCFLVPRHMVQQFVELMELNDIEAWPMPEKDEGCAAVIALFPDDKLVDEDDICDDCKAVDEAWDEKKDDGGDDEGGGKQN